MMSVNLADLVFLFDVDGVIAETPHEEAWKKAAIEWKIIDEGFDFTKFYAKSVAGEPGETGSFNILNELKTMGGKSYFEFHNISEPKQQLAKAKEFRDPVKKVFLQEYIDNNHFRGFDDIGKIILEAKNKGIAICAVSASEFAKSILGKIDAVKLAERVGVPYTPKSDDSSLLAVFDTTALGTKTAWHDVKIEKLSHYCYARGILVEARKRMNQKDNIPYVLVFEDAPKGIKAISSFDFNCIGISRKSTSGIPLASKSELANAGAGIVYDENELNGLKFEELIAAINKILA